MQLLVIAFSSLLFSVTLAAEPSKTYPGMVYDTAVVVYDVASIKAREATDWLWSSIEYYAFSPNFHFGHYNSDSLRADDAQRQQMRNAHFDQHPQEVRIHLVPTAKKIQEEGPVTYENVTRKPIKIGDGSKDYYLRHAIFIFKNWEHVHIWYAAEEICLTLAQAMSKYDGFLAEFEDLLPAPQLAEFRNHFPTSAEFRRQCQEHGVIV